MNSASSCWLKTVSDSGRRATKREYHVRLLFANTEMGSMAVVFKIEQLTRKTGGMIEV